MKRLPVIAMIHQGDAIKEKILNLTSGMEVEVVEIHNPIALLTLMAERDYRINLVITDLIFRPSDNASEVDVLQLIRSKSAQIPILTFIQTGKKESAEKCLFLGTNEYAILPCDDPGMTGRILKCLQLDQLHDDSVLKFQLRDFLENEIYKAAKGKYPFTIVKLNFLFDGDENYTGIGHNFHPHSEEMYHALKKCVWVGDTYLQYGFQSHLGIFPFCDKKKVIHLLAKLANTFYESKRGMAGIQSYKMTHAYSCYPNDGCSCDELIQVLTSRENSEFTEHHE